MRSLQERWSFFVCLILLLFINSLCKRPTITSKSTSAKQSKAKVNPDDDDLWLPRTKVHISYQGSTPRVNIKPQSKFIQALIRRAVDLGEIYIFLGTPEDDDLALDDIPKMCTPFSTMGLHAIAFLALIAAAKQLGYDEDDGDVVDRLQNGSEEFYVKPLRTHVCGLFLQATVLIFFTGLSETRACSLVDSLKNLVCFAICQQVRQGRQSIDQPPSR